MTKVQALFGGKVATPANEPVPQVVAFIERLLVRAKAGDVRAIGVTYVCGNGHRVYGWERDADPDLTYRLHSAIICLAHEFTNDINVTSADVSQKSEE